MGKSRLLSALSCRCLKERRINTLSGSSSYPLEKASEHQLPGSQLGSATLVAVFNFMLLFQSSSLEMGRNSLVSHRITAATTLKRLGTNNRGSSLILSLTLMQVHTVYCLKHRNLYEVDVRPWARITVQPCTRSSSKRTTIRNVNRGERQNIGTRLPIDSLEAGFRCGRRKNLHDLPS
jgi:hypothetical protein